MGHIRLEVQRGGIDASGTSWKRKTGTREEANERQSDGERGRKLEAREKGKHKPKTKQRSEEAKTNDQMVLQSPGKQNEPERLDQAPVQRTARGAADR